MSIILEALRKAAAERDKGALAGLYHPGAGYRGQDSEEPAEPPEHTRGLARFLGTFPALLAALGLAAGLAALLWAWNQPGQAGEAGQTGQPEAGPPPPVAAQQAKRPHVTEPEPTPPLAAAPPAQPIAASPAVSMARPAPPLTPLGAAPAAPHWEQLPAEWRQQVPPLQFGGAMASNDPASRLVFLNGQVFREGETVSEGLKVETIAHRWAVLNWRGQRFMVRY